MKQHVVNTQYLIGNIAYPVGSVFISYNDTNPQQLFGGTWTKISGKFLLSSDNNSHPTTGVSGGSETKTISVNNLPSFNTSGTTKSLTGSFLIKKTEDNRNIVTSGSGVVSVSNTSNSERTIYDKSTTQNVQSVNIDATHEHSFSGQNQSMDIMPPYVVVNMWKRETLATVETVTEV